MRLLGIAVTMVFASLLLAGCGSPPTREMDQAQGAIDAARAAGADRYATEQYDSSVKALKSAQDAVVARDYRLALNYALDSRDRAQGAAKEAASQQVTQRSGAERLLAEVAALLHSAKLQLTQAEEARLPRRTLTSARDAIAQADDALQKAGTGIQEGEYQSSQTQLSESAAKLKAAIAEIDTGLKARGVRRR
jgi:hypothetical protein